MLSNLHTTTAVLVVFESYQKSNNMRLTEGSSWQQGQPIGQRAPDSSYCSFMTANHSALLCGTHNHLPKNSKTTQTWI